MDELLQHLERLRRQARAGVCVRGLVLALLLMLAFAISLMVLDWWLRFSGTAWRLLLSALFYSVAAISLYWFWWRPVRTRVSLVDISLWLERALPEWHGLLSSAVAFSQQGQLNGLNQAVEVQAVDRLAAYGIRFEKPWRFLRRWCLVLLVVIIAISLTAAAFPASGKLAWERLTLPLHSRQWPARTRLEIIDRNGKSLPEDLALSMHELEVVEVLVRDSVGPPPRQIRFEVRYPDGTGSVTPVSPTSRRTADGRFQEVFVVAMRPRRDQGSLQYRAFSRDDHHLSWRRVHWVTLPALRNLTVDIRPPAYTGQPSQHWENLAGSLEVVEGSELKLTGTIEPAPESLWVLGPGKMSAEPVAMRNGTSFELTMPVTAVIDALAEVDLLAVPQTDNATTSTERLLIRKIPLQVVADQPPSVHLRSLQTELRLTPTGYVQAAAAAVDDLGLRSVQLFISRNDDSDRRVLTENHVDVPALAPFEMEIESPFAAEALQATPGERFLVLAIAQDWKPDRSPTVSEPLSILIVSIETKRAELEQALENWADRMHALVEEQSAILQMLKQLRADDRTVQQFSATAWQQAVQRQRELLLQLDAGSNSLKTQAIELLQDVQRNPSLEQELEALLSGLSEEITAISQVEGAEILSVSKQFPSEIGEAGLDRFSRSLQKLTAIANRLTVRLGVLKQRVEAWTAQARWLKDWNLFREQFAKCLQETAAAGGATRARTLDSLSNDERAVLNRLSRQHRDFQQRLRELMARAEQPRVRSQLPGTQPWEEMLRNQQADRAFHQAAEFIELNQTARAEKIDRQLQLALQQADAQLHAENGAEQGLEQLVERTRVWLSDSRVALAVLEKHHDNRDWEALWNDLNGVQNPLADDAAQLSSQFRLQAQHETANALHQAAVEWTQSRAALDRQEADPLWESERILASLLDQIEGFLDTLSLEVSRESRLRSLRERSARLHQLANHQAERRRQLEPYAVNPSPSRDRRTRRRFLELSGQQHQSTLEIEAVREAAESNADPALALGLQQAAAASQQLAEQIGKFTVTDPLIARQARLEQLLQALSRLVEAHVAVVESAASADERSAAVQLNRQQIEILILLQEQLVADEREIGDPPQMPVPQAEYLERQRAIDHLLRTLLDEGQ